jgi:FixJ family two-component response regulator
VAHSPVVKPRDHIVFVVDDDPGIREAVTDLLLSFDLDVVAFASAAEYIAYPKPDVPACLVLDVELPDANGLDLQSQPGQSHPHIVFITGYGDIPQSVRAIKAGAVDFLTKPLKESELIRAILAAITQDRAAKLERAELAELQRRLSCLTPREREVLPLVVSGLLNKQVAAELGISDITIQIHRGRIMKKMEADSLAELVRMAGRLEIPLSGRRQIETRRTS